MFVDVLPLSYFNLMDFAMYYYTPHWYWMFFTTRWHHSQKTDVTLPALSFPTPSLQCKSHPQDNKPYYIFSMNLKAGWHLLYSS